MRTFVLTAAALGLMLALAVTLAWLSGRSSGPKQAPRLGPEVQRPPAPPAAPKLPIRFDDWLQDCELAKQQAAREKKVVLVFFTASGRSEAAERMADALLDKDFWKPAVETLVPVYIDLADGGRARAPIRDPGRNVRLWQQWLPREFPAVLLIEPDRGRVIGTFGPLNVSPDKYYQAAAEALKGRNQLDELFHRIELADGQAKLSAAQSALQHLGRVKLLPYYEPELRAWVRLAETIDPENRTGLPEYFFLSHWDVQLQRLVYQSFMDGPGALGGEPPEGTRRAAHGLVGPAPLSRSGPSGGFVPAGRAHARPKWTDRRGVRPAPTGTSLAPSGPAAGGGHPAR
jgi:hypothetical protein